MRLFERLAVTLLLGSSLGLGMTPASAALPAAVDGTPMPTLAPMLENVTPAVVNIATQSHVRIRENPLLSDPFFRHFFDLPDVPRKRQTQSLGSGVVVDAEKGYVLTNHHVIDKADHIRVMLSDRRTFEAKLIGADPESDVAVIQIPAENLTALPLADSDSLLVGDFGVAIGNPFGLGQTVTSGIVSALGRSGLGIEGYEDFIQTDASINPGNSGGALVNLRGELVGLNTAIIAPGGGNVGIGFAIPTNMARSIMEQLVTHGEIRRGLLGVTAQDVTPALAKAFGLPIARGVIVAEVEADSAAQMADVRVGDVVLSINGREVTDASDVRNRIGLLRVGEKVRLGILREGERLQLEATVSEAPQARRDGARLHPRLAGAVFENVAADSPGVRVVAVERNSAAVQAGLRADDVLVSVNRQPIRDLIHFEKELKQAGDPGLLLNVKRGSGALFLLIR